MKIDDKTIIEQGFSHNQKYNDFTYKFESLLDKDPINKMINNRKSLNLKPNCKIAI